MSLNIWSQFQEAMHGHGGERKPRVFNVRVTWPSLLSVTSGNMVLAAPPFPSCSHPTHHKKKWLFSKCKSIHFCHLLGMLYCSHHIWEKKKSGLFTWPTQCGLIQGPQPAPLQLRAHLQPSLSEPFCAVITQHLHRCLGPGVCFH